MRQPTPVQFTRELIEEKIQEALRLGKRLVIFANDLNRQYRGYRLEITPRGTVRFSLVYKSPETGRSRNFALGSWPGMTDAEARRRVLALRAEINRGHDPMSVPRIEARLPEGPMESAALPNGTEGGRVQWQ